jgi:hypothetical protein
LYPSSNIRLGYVREDGVGMIYNNHSWSKKLKGKDQLGDLDG